MTKPIVSVDAAMYIRYCARLVERFNLARALVIDNGKLDGVVSLTRMELHGIRK